MSDVGIGTFVIRQTDRYEYEIRRDRSKWRLAYEEAEIVGETRVSWIISKKGGSSNDWDAKKVKKRDWPAGMYLSWEQVDREHWAHSNAYAISEAVRRLRGPDMYEKLRSVAEIIGYMGDP